MRKRRGDSPKRDLNPIKGVRPAVEIARRAGTTRKATSYGWRQGNGEHILKLTDLPGFENTAYVREWFETQKDHPGDLAKAIVEEHKSQKEFGGECEFFRSLDGVAVLFVVDATKPVQQKDRDQAEILRLCADKRHGIINVQDDKHRDSSSRKIEAGWEELLGRTCTYSRFNPHRANFADRIKLLETLARVRPGWCDSMELAIETIRADWEHRIKDVTDLFIDLLEDVMVVRTSETIKVTAEGDRSEA